MDILTSGCRILPGIINVLKVKVILDNKLFNVSLRLIPGMYWNENLLPKSLIYVKNLLTLQSESVS